jgi:hypothetical protein
MVRRIEWVFVAAMAFAAAGCIGERGSWMYPHRNMETLAETRDEHRDRVHGVLEQDRRALAEDLDLLFQTDRPTRLTRWHSK